MMTWEFDSALEELKGTILSYFAHVGSSPYSFLVWENSEPSSLQVGELVGGKTMHQRQKTMGRESVGDLEREISHIPAEESQTLFAWEWHRRLLVTSAMKRSWLSRAWDCLWPVSVQVVGPQVTLVRTFLPIPAAWSDLPSGPWSHQHSLWGFWAEVTRGLLRAALHWKRALPFLASLGPPGTPKVWNMMIWRGSFWRQITNVCILYIYIWKCLKEFKKEQF